MTSAANPSMPVRAAIYLRISQDREMDGLAIERQQEDCVRLAKHRGWNVVQTYTDQSKSATDKTKSRPGYDQMVADYLAGHFTAIVCYDLARLTRQPRQLEDWIDWAETRGLALVTANGDADLATDGGRMYARIKAAVARSEVERKSARQSRAHIQRAAQGRAPKGTRPLGYATSGETIPHEAEAVKAIYAAFAAGASLRAIARALSGNPEGDTRGIPALPKHSRSLVMERNAKRADEGLAPKPVPADGPWAESTVLGILRNPRYAGYSVYTNIKDRRDAVSANKEKLADGERPRSKRKAWREFIVTQENGQPVMGQWEALVGEELWRSVQDKLDDPARVTNRKGTHRRHLGSGLYHCGIEGCGNLVRGASRGYRCKESGHVNRTGPAIDDFVTRVISARLAEPDALEKIPQPQSARVTEIMAELEKQRNKISRAQRDYDDEIIEGRDLKRVRDEATSRIEALDAERLTLSHGAGVLPILRTENPSAAFLAADLGIRRSVVDALCTVTLLPQKQGIKGFDPTSVIVEWKQ